MNNTKPGASSAKSSGRKQRVRLQRRNLPLLLLVTRDGIASFFRPIFKAYGLTEQKWRILRDLYENGESSIGTIVERCHILGPSLSGILDRMATAGLLVQRVDEQDMRRYFVSLTKLGRARFEEMAPVIEGAYAKLEAKIGEEPLALLYDNLDRVLAELASGQS